VGTDSATSGLSAHPVSQMQSQQISMKRFMGGAP